jgi:hypothetical protein
MSTPTNSLMVVLLTTIISFGIYAEDQQPQNPQTTQFDLAECLQAASISYKKHAQKMEPLCNPVGLVGTAITSAFLGAKKLGFLALGVVVVVNSPAIKKQIEEYSALNQEKINQDPKLELEKINSNNSDQKTE